MRFLLSNVGAGETVWEWGSGETTVQLAAACKYVTTVEHQAEFASRVVRWADGRRNVSVIYAPPDLPYVEGGDDDGDLATFRRYVECYSGRGIDVVLIDGRARCAAALWVAERAPFGPHPDMKIFLHDVDRPQLEPIWKDQVIGDGDQKTIVKSIFVEQSRVERLALLRMRMP